MFMVMNIFFLYNDDEDKELIESLSSKFKQASYGKFIDNFEYGYDIIIAPFTDIFNTTFFSFDHIRKYRKTGNWSTPIFFLLRSPYHKPDYLNPETIEHPIVENLLGNQEFGVVDKATFYAEVIYDNNSYSDILLNLIELSLDDQFDKRFFQQIEKTIKHVNANKEQYKKYKQSFYNTFIKFYECNRDDNKPFYELTVDDLRSNSQGDASEPWQSVQKFLSGHPYCQDLTANNLTIRYILEFAEVINAATTGDKVPEAHGGHHIPLGMFSAPRPFPLHELIDTKNKIEQAIEGNTIKLLLIDNRAESKFRSTICSDGKGTIHKIFKEFDLENFFELRMLEHPFNSDDPDLNNLDLTKEEFDFEKFRNPKKIMGLSQSENPWTISPWTYADKVYNKISEAHFVLLDFFLNKADTYHAFDFIRDFAQTKRKKSDYRTTWYFITSSVHDDVTKFMQSGLLSEYYESAVVNTGDNPDNEKRKIIFVYKLLSFILARMNSFQGLVDSIAKCNVLNCSQENSKDCCERCLAHVQSVLRKYLAEHEEITRIFPKLKATEKEFKDLVSLLDSILNHFYMLPEADWAIINMEIESFDSRVSRQHLNQDILKKKFSCKYILTELERRSKIY